MTQDEYHEFWRHASTVFRQVQNLFRKDSEGKPLESDDRKALHDTWYAVLNDVTPEDAKAAIEAMLADETMQPQYGWSNFPTRIRSHATRLGSTESMLYTEHQERMQNEQRECSSEQEELRLLETEVGEQLDGLSQSDCDALAGKTLKYHPAILDWYKQKRPDQPEIEGRHSTFVRIYLLRALSDPIAVTSPHEWKA